MFSITIQNLDKLRDAFNRSPKIASKHLEGAVKESAKELYRAEVREAPVCFGNLKRSIQVSYTPIKATIMPTANYAAYVQYGTRPHFPPPGALTGWAAKRGMNPWALAIAISRKGTTANPFITRAIDQTTDAINKLFALALRAIRDELAS